MLQESGLTFRAKELPEVLSDVLLLVLKQMHFRYTAEMSELADKLEKITRSIREYVREKDNHAVFEVVDDYFDARDAREMGYTDEEIDQAYEQFNEEVDSTNKLGEFIDKTFRDVLYIEEGYDARGFDKNGYLRRMWQPPAKYVRRDKWTPIDWDVAKIAQEI